MLKYSCIAHSAFTGGIMDDENWGMPVELYGMRVTRFQAMVMAEIKKAIASNPKADWDDIFTLVELSKRIPLIFIRFAFVRGICEREKSTT